MTAAERCLRPGCQGGIQDGYCDTCGMAPAVNTGSSPSRTSQSSSRSGRTASGRTSGRTSSRGSSGRSRRGLLGIGLVEVPARLPDEPSAPRADRAARPVRVVRPAFGLARVRLAGGDRAGVVAVLDSVPATSSFRIDAQLAAITARVRDLSPAEMIHDELIEAAGRLEALGLGVERRERLAAEVLRATLDWLLDADGTPAGTVLGLPLAERELRFGLERSFRALARLAPRARERVVLV
ncbi:MAG: pknG, partial [Actinomycetia bacterium]|nr:pknG [Actinomycetes bacterium]